MRQSGPLRRGLPVWIGLLVLTLPQVGTALDPDVPDSPRASLSPSEVVRIQVEALRANDERDDGIAVAFRFASPANKQQTGPLSRFAQMIRSDPYRLMLEHDKAVYAPIEVVERVARQRVTLFGPRRTLTFVFFLSRQPAGRWKDCWMTDAVVVEPVEGVTA